MDVPCHVQSTAAVRRLHAHSHESHSPSGLFMTLVNCSFFCGRMIQQHRQKQEFDTQVFSPEINTIEITYFYF